MFETKNKISFSTFYLVEFFRLSGELGRSQIPEDQYEMLADLGNYLTSETDVLPGLEKLAQYQGTNDLSIFLFDLSERIQDNSAAESFAGLNNLVEDFINLFGLMMEEKESVRDLGRVLEYFRAQKPVTDKQVTIPEDLVEETEKISFAEFFEAELSRLFDQSLAEFPDENKADFSKLRHIFMNDNSENQTYDPTVRRIQSVLVQLQAQVNAGTYQTLEPKLKKLVQLFSDLHKKNPDHYLSILENDQIPELHKASETPMTVDALLEDYFLSEVDEQIFQIQKAFAEEDSVKAIEQHLKAFKSLKELSMIHGYGGIEYFAEQVLFALASASDKRERLSVKSKDILNQITEEMVQLERYKDESQIENIKEFVNKLKASYEVAPEPKPQAPVQPKPKPEPKTTAETEPENVAEAEPEIEAHPELTIKEIEFNDKEQLLPILRETLQELFIKYKNDRQQHPEMAWSDLAKFSFAAIGLLNPDQSGKLKDSFLNFAAEAQNKSADKQDELWVGLEPVWADTTQNWQNEAELADSLAILNTALQVKQAEGLGIDDEEKIREALVSSMRLAWKAILKDIDAYLINPDEAGAANLRSYLNLFEANIRLAGYDSFKTVIDYFRIFETRATGLPAELSTEVQKSFELSLDRLLSAGKSADYSDILDILEEVLTPDEETQEPVEPTLSDEEELEQDFREECTEQLQSIHDALAEFKNDLNNRKPLSQIINAVHSIRSSAHLLNKNEISEFSVNLEEAAEMFEPVEVAIPENLISVFGSAANQLLQMIAGANPDTSETEKQIDLMVNSLILEEDEGDEIVAPEAAVEEVISEAEDAQPLFAEEEEVDDELLSIFKEESEKYLMTLQECTDVLKGDLNNEEALNQLEYASHSLRSSAKMLGFREISQLTAGMEEVVEAIKKHEVDNSSTILEQIEQTIFTIQQIRKGEKISSGALAKAIRLLDVSKKKPEPKDPKEAKEAAAEKDAPNSDYMKNIFVGEVNDLLESLDKDLLGLEEMPESATLLSEIIRNLHTLKGGAMMVNYTKIGELAHKLEDYFQLYREQNGEVKQEMLAPAFTTLDLIREMVKAIDDGKEEAIAQFTSKLAEIDNKLFFYQNFDPDRILKKPEIALNSAEQVVQTPRKKEENVVKINTEYLDNLVNMATELVVNRTELSSHFDDLKELMTKITDGKKQIHYMQNRLDDIVEDAVGPDVSEDSENEEIAGVQHVSEEFKVVSSAIDRMTSDLTRLSHQFEKNIQQISNLSKTLHKDILRVRMLPVEYLFDRFPRSVRDLARSQDKRVTVEVEGNETELDRAVIEALADPIMHILRNAVDHGIESGAVRKKKKKPKTGKIILKARQEKSQVVIDISDDGQGIDLNKIKRQAVKRGLASQAELKKMNEAEILDYIFYPEFSTKEKTTNISGRGVGLDVVATQIQKLKGVIRIRTEKNAGTTFSIRVPLTLVISQALMTRINTHNIAIPMVAVQESQEIATKDILVDDNKRYIQARGKLLPYIHLSEVLSFNEKAPVEEENIQVLILHDAGISVALGIGEITGRQEIVIKSLGATLQNVEYIAGGTILGNGEVALILDYVAIIRMIEFQFFGNIRESRTQKASGKKKTATRKMELQTAKEGTDLNKSIPHKTIKGRKPRALIVDDSISVRSFVGTVLEKEGFNTVKATDGLEAIEILEKDTFDIMITDLEMPQLGGFKLIEKARARKELLEMPIVILTGRTGKAQRERGTKLGANAFIGKPFKEEDLVVVVRGFISN